MSNNRTLTENLSATYTTSADPRVDFFFHITEDAELEKTTDLLAKSWDCEPTDTLRLIAYLRDCRNGKGIRRQYQMCLLWLFENHYKTLVENLSQFVSFGYWKDLTHLLMILLFDGLIPEYLAVDDSAKSKDKAKRGKKKNKFSLYDRLVLKNVRKILKEKAKQQKLLNELKEMNEKLNKDNKESNDSKMEEVVEECLQTVNTRNQELIEKRKQFARNRYENDEKYRLLYDRIVIEFAKQLKTDLEKMAKNNKSISLAGKWAPTNGHHFDKYLSISSAIAIQLCKSLNKMELISNTVKLSVFYQKEVCAPLRQYLKIPEVYMSAKNWGGIDYNRVASKCMQKNKSVFIKHDSERFKEFLASKKTVAGATLKPVELVERGLALIQREEFLSYENEDQMIADQNDSEEEGEVVDEGLGPSPGKTAKKAFALEKEVLEKQWLSLSEDIKKKGGGLLDNALAICDVSGSMNGTPMHAAIGLTILVMQMSSSPWSSVCITFSEHPELHEVNPEWSFIEKLVSIKDMKWGYNTNLNAVFTLILNNAIKYSLSSEQIPKLLLVFTDMEFDNAFPGTALTNFEYAKQEWEQHGYQLPTIAFWNLRSDTTLTSTPVQVNEMGTFLLSGYSGQQLSLILNNKDFSKITPISMMRQAIDNERYKGLKVYD